ncbi:MAG: CHAT domain-containing protein, partial [Bacteroidota bacterium]
ALSQRKLAILNWRRDNVDLAIDFYDGTFENYFNQINTFFPILSEQEKSKFYYNKLRPTFEQFNSFVVETSADNGALIGKMYNYQLATKGIILAATTKVREAILDSGDDALIEKYETWIGQKEELARLFSASTMAIDERNQQIDSLSTLANELEKQLSETSSAFKTAFANQQYSWKDVQSKLKPGEAAVEVIRFRDFDPMRGGSYTEEVYYAALVVTSETVDAPKLVLMENGKMMETRYLTNYRNAIQYQVNENYSYKLFWKPISEHLANVEKVYFSPDGVYNQISIYTLQNPESKQFTIDEVEIQLVNNTKDLITYNFDKKTQFGKASYLFGFPNYNMGALEETSSAITTADVTEFSQAAAENRGNRGGARGGRGGGSFGEPAAGSMSRGAIPRGIRGNLLRYVDNNSLLALLPGTQKEVKIIDSLWQEKNEEPIVFMSDEAVEERIKEVKSPQTLHIATHGFFLQNEDGAAAEGTEDNYVENPLLRSGLILAGANSYISHGRISNSDRPEDDGILTAFEAMNLNLDDTELVVLSACETGLGEVQNGEGVFGLQRSFQVAGADAIIMSMWTVDDNATQELMTNFYEEWLESGDKHGAFIEAQKRLKEKYTAPYYWGAFVMVGN